LRLDADAAWSAPHERVVLRAEPLWPRIESKGEPMIDKPEAPVSTATPAAAVPPEPQAAPAAPAAAPEAPAPAAAPPAASAPAAAPAEADKIGIEEFARLEFRVAKVMAAEKVKGSKKLIKMQIDLGTEQRTIVAGIADAYEAEALVGRSIVVVANLKPARLMGIESNGMVLAASPEGGKPVLLGFVEDPPPPGSRVR